MSGCNHIDWPTKKCVFCGAGGKRPVRRTEHYITTNETIRRTYRVMLDADRARDAAHSLSLERYEPEDIEYLGEEIIGVNER